MAFESQKETRNEGMETVEAASEIILLLSLLGISGMAEQASDAMDRSCEKVKNGVLVRFTYDGTKIKFYLEKSGEKNERNSHNR